MYKFKILIEKLTYFKVRYNNEDNNFDNLQALYIVRFSNKNYELIAKIVNFQISLPANYYNASCQQISTH